VPNRRGGMSFASSNSNRGCDSLWPMKRFVILLGVTLMVLGVVGLVHPSFNYHQQEELTKFGPIKATVDEEKTAQIPAAVSITSLVAGIVLVVFGPRMKR
jgi:hypothetical protein